ncbi:MAG TPA: thiol reductant ABC exporter subunit CydC [Clostridia bacterium]|nr:thiol reductant ABC exporter subunit CydC [Clostridia bacterium]
MMTVLQPFIRLMLPYWKPVLLGLVLAFATISSNVGLMVTSAYLISWSALQPPVLDLMTLVAGVRFFGLSRAAFRYAERYVNHRTTFAILTRIRLWIYDSLVKQSPGQLLGYHSGQLLARLVADVEALKDIYLRVLLPPLTALLIWIVGTVLLGSFHWGYALSFSLFYGLAGLGVPWLVRKMARFKQELAGARDRLNTTLVDSIKGLTEVTSFDLAARQTEKAAGHGNTFAQWQQLVYTRSALTGTLTQLLANLAMFATLCLSVYFASTGHIRGIWVAALTLGVLAAFEAIFNLTQVVPHLEDSLEAGERVLALVNTPPFVTRPAAQPMANPGREVRVHNLTFAYPNAGQVVLRNISFHLPAGGKLAIIGPSGAGKSTVAQLLLGYWPYHEGSITIGGREVSSFSEAELWSTVGLVSRQTYLFNATIRENLLLAKPDATEAELLAAVERVHLAPHLAVLPQGLDTVIGEGGWKLSGGQRQLVALARTFLRNPSILVLDEATEGLDPVTEEQVLAAIHRLMEGRTTIMITHHLTGLEAMDEILVLDRGEIVERGSHEELLAKGGLYRRLYGLQEVS